jgi:phosphatidylinositol-3-phosphatase
VPGLITVRALALAAAVVVGMSACGAPHATRRAASDGLTSSYRSVPLAATVAGTPATRAAATSRRPCLGTTPPAHYDHVIWIVMENKAASAVRGTVAPATTSIAARCGATADYHAVTHPSLPNYIALTSGTTHGITDDAAPSKHRIGGSSIFSLVAASHRRWATYAESMPIACARTSSGRYAVRHNPATYYTTLARTCAANDVPMGTPTSGRLATALRTNTLPAFTLMIPNLCNDTHDCSVATGDRWLGRWLTAITSSPTYAAGRTAVFVTWDEDDDTRVNRVLLVVIAPSVRAGTVIRGRYNHLNLLRTTEDMLGLPAVLAPRSASLRRLAHL